MSITFALMVLLLITFGWVAGMRLWWIHTDCKRDEPPFRNEDDPAWRAERWDLDR